MFGERKSNPVLNFKTSLLNLKSIKKEYDNLQDEIDENVLDLDNDYQIKIVNDTHDDLEGT